MFQTATGNELTLSKANPWKTFPLILLTKQKVLSNKEKRMELGLILFVISTLRSPGYYKTMKGYFVSI